METVHVFEEVGGRTLEVQFVPEEALLAQQEGPRDPLKQPLADLMCSYSRDAEAEMGTMLEAYPCA